MKDKLVAGLLAIFLGAYGVHHFYLGDNRKGVIYLLITLLTAGFGGTIMQIIGIVEGVRYLTMSDEEWAKFTNQPAPSQSSHPDESQSDESEPEPVVYVDHQDSKCDSYDDTKSSNNDVFF